jgi:predicted small secreted protein
MMRIRLWPRTQGLLALVLVLSMLLAACQPTTPAPPNTPVLTSEPAETAAEATEPATAEGDASGGLLRLAIASGPITSIRWMLCRVLKALRRSGPMPSW